MTITNDAHLTMVPAGHAAHPYGCEDCLRVGSSGVHRRLCLTCGHIGCCDSSPLRHGRQHAYGTGHPIVASLEPGEERRWCYLDENFV